MWAEIILSRDDLSRLLSQAFPLTLHLDAGHLDARHLDEGERAHSLSLSDLSQVTLVPDLGLRVVCRAHVHWPVLGIDVPVGLKSLDLLLLPTVEAGPDGDRLVFRLSIEEADFSGIPAAIDRGITAAINAKLAERHTELSWDFSRALACNAPLPALLEPLASFSIRPAWGKVRVTAEAVVYAASFHAALVRAGEPAPRDLVMPLPGAPAPPPRARPGRSAAADRALLAGVLGLAAGAGYLATRALSRAGSLGQ